MLLAVGTALLLDSVALVLFGEKQRGVPDVIPGVWQVAGAFIPWRRVLVFGVAVALTAAFLAFIQYTRPGRALRAIAQDRETAAAHGAAHHPQASFATLPWGEIAAAFLVQAVTTIFSREPIDEFPGRTL